MRIILLCLFFSFLFIFCNQKKSSEEVVQKSDEDILCTQDQAILSANSFLSDKYGRISTEKKPLYINTYKDSIWYIHDKEDLSSYGPMIYVLISKKDCSILDHGVGK